ncbi:hypothetical protein AAVH_25958 [Aphelenchoides avenae]|nr:hypothetical protein AAVH_25958 [Aphelenchus avenae]
MHPVLFYEALFFSSRDDLECLQLLSRTLRDMIVYSSNVLPLRPICHVWMNHNSSTTNKIRIEKCAAGGGDEHDYYEASVYDGDFAGTFRRLQHTCINKFSFAVRDSPFLRYWRAQEASDFVVTWICFRQPETTDYDIFDSIVNHLRPRITGVGVVECSWRGNGRYGKAVKLLARDSVLNHLQTCRLRVGSGVFWFPPSSFIFEAPGFPNYEMWFNDSPGPSEIPAKNEPPGRVTQLGRQGPGYLPCNVAAEIDGFIQSFIRDGCTNKKPNKPTEADVPLPRMYMLEPIVRSDHRVTQCETHAFVNAKQRQQLEVFKWTIEHEHKGRRHTTTLLQCRVNDL